MAVTLTTGTELPQRTSLRGGLLDRAEDLPDNWEGSGRVAVPWYGCGQPIVRDKCIVAEDVPHRGTITEYQAFPVEQGATCSTIGNLDLDEHARNRLAATTEWAVARQLQSDLAATGQPKLDDGAVIGTGVDIVEAVSALEQEAAETGFGTPWVLHAPTRLAAYLVEKGLVGPNGETPGGGTWVISPGYTGTAPDDPANSWISATGPVWADVSGSVVRSAVNHRQNESTSWALGFGLVAFDPCINLRYLITPCSTCGGGVGA